ncbi:MAG: hypothetical protein ACQEUD_06790 [Bacillota bacterium]
MTLIFQSFIGSVVIHVIYIVGVMLVGYLKTKNYKPNMASSWDKAETLQSEVVFGKVSSPFLYFILFLGITVICGVVISLYKLFT